MKVIAFDGFWLCGGPPSGVNVLVSLIYSWSRLHPEDRLIVFIPSKRKNRFPMNDIKNIEFVERPFRTQNHGLWVMLEMLPKKFKADAILTQNFTPIRGRNSSHLQFTFCHDLIFMERPEWFTPKERIYLWMMAARLNKANFVLTSSNAEKNRITKCIPKISRKIIATGLDVPIPIQLTNHEQSNKLSIINKPYVLSVGRLNVRKNLSNLVSAFSMSSLHDTHMLCIVGESNGKFRLVDSSSKNVLFLEVVSYPELAWLYSHATLFVFPSLDEGFGLPLVEANYFNCPSIASEIAPFREIDIAMAYFDPISPKDIENKMETAILRLKLGKPEVNKYDGSWTIPIQRIREAM